MKCRATFLEGHHSNFERFRLQLREDIVAVPAVVCAVLGSPGNEFLGPSKSESGTWAKRDCACRQWTCLVQQGHGKAQDHGHQRSPRPRSSSRCQLCLGQLEGPPWARGLAWAEGRRAGVPGADTLGPGAERGRRRSSAWAAPRGRQGALPLLAQPLGGSRRCRGRGRRGGT